VCLAQGNQTQLNSELMAAIEQLDSMLISDSIRSAEESQKGNEPLDSLSSAITEALYTQMKNIQKEDLGRFAPISKGILETAFNDGPTDPKLLEKKLENAWMAHIKEATYKMEKRMLKLDMQPIENIVQHSRPVAVAKKLTPPVDSKLKARFETLMNPKKHFNVFEISLERGQFNVKEQLDMAKKILESARGVQDSEKNWEWFEKFSLAHEHYLDAEQSVAYLRSSMRIDFLDEIEDALAVLSRHKENVEVVQSGILVYRDDFVRRIQTVASDLNAEYRALHRKANEVGGRLDEKWAIQAFREHRWNQIKTIATHIYNQGRLTIIKRAFVMVPYLAV
jgi:hypothetical protein